MPEISGWISRILIIYLLLTAIKTAYAAEPPPIFIEQNSDMVFYLFFLTLFLFIGIVLGILLSLAIKRRSHYSSINHLGLLSLEEKYYPREELVGKIVYTSKGMKLGDIIDLGYSKGGEIALVVRVAKGKEKIVLYDMIEVIGDIVFLSSELEKERETSSFRNLKKIKE